MRLRIARVTVMLCILVAPTAWAELSENLELSLDVRWRPESDRTLLAESSTLEASHLLRTRINAAVTTESMTKAFVQIQDSRIFGQDAAEPTTGSDDLSVHQAYLEIGRFFHPAFALRAGRFEMAYGNERVLGADVWSNRGRTFDGARFSFRTSDVEFDILYAKLAEHMTDADSRDTELWGAYTRFPEAGTDVYALLDYDARKIGDARLLQRVTVGSYSSRTIVGKLDYTANAAYQLGTMLDTDISAYLVTFALGLEARWLSARSVFGLDLASGNDPAKESWNAFQNDYYSPHRFRGLMDQFMSSNSEGLLDLYFSERLTPHSSWSFLAEAHWFRTDQPFASAVDGSAVQDLGYEVDAVLSTTHLAGATMSLGGSVFMPSEDWKGSEPDLETWAYAQVGVSLR